MKPVSAEILTIGDEILYGQILDTNSQWISQEFDKVGIKIVAKTSVGDNEPDILQAFSVAEKRADITLITGGLGPTNDDLTKPCLAKYFDSPISLHPVALKEITNLFESRGFELTPTNRRQAELPDKCTMLSNRNGSAPGMLFERAGKVFISLPGVPFEMKAMIPDPVIPLLQNKFHLPVIYHKTIRTAGIGESWLSDQIKNWEDALPEHIKLAYLPNLGQVRLRLTALGNDMSKLQAEVDSEILKVKPLIDQYIYSWDGEALEEAVGKLLRARKLTIATAESCSGGFVAHQITRIPGSSDYFKGGVIPYDNELKKSILDVRRETLAEFGAVSEETVMEMATNVRQKFGADIGVSSTGIAGPGGGTDEKPVGTIWIAYSDKDQIKTRKLKLGLIRENNIKYTALAILNMVRIMVNKIEKTA